MGTKVTSSSGSVLEEPEIQKLQMQAKIFKENSLNKLNELKSTTQLLEKENIFVADSTKAMVQRYNHSVTSSGDETSSGIVSDEEIDEQNLEAHSVFLAKDSGVLNQKHDELVKKSLLQVTTKVISKRTQKVISDLKSIQTIHMLAPKCSTYNGRPTFANPRYLKKAQSDKPCLYEIPFDTSDPANRFAPDREETMTLDNESRSKLDKDTVKPYDYTRQNSLYEIFKGPSLEYLYQLERKRS
ncbi:hypothetical protein Tco_0870023 [Tanacetum coccineum]